MILAGLFATTDWMHSLKSFPEASTDGMITVTSVDLRVGLAKTADGVYK